jgi:uridine kinase
LTPELETAKSAIVSEIQRRMADRSTPLVVALDGRSGSGKSTVAALVGNELHATVIPTDDFFNANVTDEEWNDRTAEAKASDAIDWRRLKAEAIQPLLEGHVAEWHPFDFEAGARPDGTYGISSRPTKRNPSNVILLDGAYSSRPELQDVVDFSILIETPVQVRHERLTNREESEFLEKWHKRWDEAEEFYFTHVRPRSSFGLVVDN